MKLYKSAPFLEIETQKIDIIQRKTAEGIIFLKSTIPLKSRAYRMTANLEKWAKIKPNQVFLGQKTPTDTWQTINYAQTHSDVLSIAQWLIDSGANANNPIAILSENCIENGLFGIAALHIGLPFSPITPAYALKSSDYAKLKHTIKLLNPKIIFVSDGAIYQNALAEIAQGCEVVYIKNKPAGDFKATSIAEIRQTIATSSVNLAHEAIQPETIAKIMFTSGSTGLPKGVINTHQNITSNWQQIAQVFPIMKDGFTICDWLPWNHTFGSNHNLGLTLVNGGSLYIDDGNPSPTGIQNTIKNLHEISPDIYFNVPKGYEELIPYLQNDDILRVKFFSNLKFLFYAGAGLPQHVWDAYEELAYETTSRRLLISTGLGCTEASPSAMFNTHFGSFAGMLGVPVQGLELKLVPIAGKLEARFKGENIMPGYFRNAEATANAFDDEGFYKTGDALKFVDENNPNAGMVFDGRIAEDFKLSSGTWVSVGAVRAKLIEISNGFIQDVVVAGHDKNYLSVLVFLDALYLKNKFNLTPTSNLESSQNITLQNFLFDVLAEYNKTEKGNASKIEKGIIAPFELSAEKGELTEKGSINQNAVNRNYAKLIEKFYIKI